MTHPPAVGDFRELAEGFCAWCEADTIGARPESTAAFWIARLHAAAYELPEANPDNEQGIPELHAGPLARAERNLLHFGGTYYRLVFNPDPTGIDEPVVGDVGDDLLDTYKDVKAGCMLFDLGRNQDALWFWSYMHRLHWGQHVVGALTALYWHLRNEGNAA